VGFTQILVYVGAVAILAVFAIMMTHNDKPMALPDSSSAWVSGCIVAAAVFAVLARAIVSTAPSAQAQPQPVAPVQQIGDALMHRFVLPLEIMGLLLTAALIGAVVIAMDRREEMK
jgi:NADH-quinone oxidoreductase subunit J